MKNKYFILLLACFFAGSNKAVDFVSIAMGGLYLSGSYFLGKITKERYDKKYNTLSAKIVEKVLLIDPVQILRKIKNQIDLAFITAFGDKNYKEWYGKVLQEENGCEEIENKINSAFFTFSNVSDFFQSDKTNIVTAGLSMVTGIAGVYLMINGIKG